MVSISGQASGLAYPTSKFAVNGLTVSLARELGPRGIRVNAVAPGITETDMMKAVPKEVLDPLVRQIPLRRLGKPEDIGKGVEFLRQISDHHPEAQEELKKYKKGLFGGWKRR